MDTICYKCIFPLMCYKCKLPYCRDRSPLSDSGRAITVHTCSKGHGRITLFCPLSVSSLYTDIHFPAGCVVRIQKFEERRLNLKLTQVYKIAHGICYFPYNIFVLHESHSVRLAKPHTMLCPYARTSYYFHSFVPSGVRAWNSLEELQAYAGSLH